MYTPNAHILHHCGLSLAANYLSTGCAGSWHIPIACLVCAPGLRLPQDYLLVFAVEIR